MPAVQTSYPQTLRPAVAGMKADMTPETVISRVVEGAGGIGFGIAVVQGTGDRQVKVSAASTKFVGVTLMDQTVTPLLSTGTVDTFAAGDVAPVMIKGTVWVLVGATVAAGDPAYIVPATGVFTNVSTSNTAVNGRFDTSAASGALAILRLV